MQADAVKSEMQELRELLLLTPLEKIHHSVKLTGDSSLLVNDALHKHPPAQSEITEALEGYLDYSMPDLIARDPEKYGAALAPVIGPAIRSAIAQAIAALNEKIEGVTTSISPRSLLWRARAKRLNIPFRTYVMAKNKSFWVERVIWANDEGILLRDVSSSKAEEDNAMFSAVLMTLRSYSADALNLQVERFGCDVIELGGRVIVVSAVGQSIFAVVAHGSIKPDFKDLLMDQHLALLSKAKDEVKSFVGDVSIFAKYERHLQKALQIGEEVKTDAPKRGVKFYFFVAVIIAALVALGYYFWQTREHSKDVERSAQLLDATPGIEVLSHEDDKIVILRDRLAPPASTLVQGLSGLTIKEIPYLSADPKIGWERLRRSYPLASLSISKNLVTCSKSCEQVMGFPFESYGLTLVTN